MARPCAWCCSPPRCAGYASREDREKALAAGFDRHLVKPPSLEELEQALSD
jgi:CheY-like chemotaxis protein